MSWISKVVEKQDATIAMLLDWICTIFALVINLSLSLANGLESNEALRLDIKGISSTKLDYKVEGANTGDLSNKLWRIFKTFLVVCSYVAFKCSNISSRCNVVCFYPFSLLVIVLNSFKVSQRQSFTVSIANTRYGGCTW